MLLSACAPTIQTTPTPTSIPVFPELAPVDLPVSEWGTVELIGQAEHLAAPVPILLDEASAFVWTGSQGEEARHFSRGVEGNAQIMALSAYFPQRQQLFAVDDGVLMTWLDRSDSEFDLRLQVGRFGENGVAEVGPVTVSTQRTQNYDAIQLDETTVRIVWSGGLEQVTNLYLHQVDNFGRPFSGNRLRIDADYPALIQATDGKVYLFWLENNRRDVYMGRFDETAEPTLVDIRRIASTNLNGTDALEHFTVGYDGETAYIFWNIRRIDNDRSVLMSSGQLNDERFSEPVPLLASDGFTIQWANVPNRVQSPLPVVTNSGNELLVLWLEDGTVVESEFVIESGQLLGLTEIVVDDSHIGVSWSQPTEMGFANLFYVSRERE